MEDREIIELYWGRSTQAISETEQKYGKLCRSIANNVLCNWEDAEESVNDTYLAAWNAIPPHRPANLLAFLAKLARRIAINRYYTVTAEKRGGGQVQQALDELKDCTDPTPSVEDVVLGKEVGSALNRFLETLPETERTVFVRRYFLLDPVRDIGRSFGFTEAKVTSMLYRIRKKLRAYLEKEGYL